MVEIAGCHRRKAVLVWLPAPTIAPQSARTDFPVLSCSRLAETLEIGGRPVDERPNNPSRLPVPESPDMRLALLAVFALAACAPSTPSGGSEEGRTVLFRPNAESPRNSAPDRVSMQELANMTGGRCAEALESAFLGVRSSRYYYALKCSGQELLVGVNKDAPPEVLTCAEAGAAGKPCKGPWPADPAPAG